MKFTQILLIFSILALASCAVRNRRQSGRVCPDICPALFDPTCGSNRDCFRVFSNGCQLDLYNCNANPEDEYIAVDLVNCDHFVDFNFKMC